MISINRNLKIFVPVFLYWFFLIFFYDEYIVELYAYKGFEGALASERILLAGIFIFLFSLFIECRNLTAETMFSLFYFLMSFLPISTLYIYQQVHHFTLLVVALPLCILFLGRKIRVNAYVRLASIRTDSLFRYFFSICVAAILTWALFNSNSLFLSLDKVYEIREMASEGSNSRLLTLLFRAVLPAALIYFLLNKHHLSVAVSLLGFYLLYVSTGHKSVLATGLLIFSFYIIGKRGLTASFVTWSFISMLLLAAVAYELFEIVEPIGYLVRRALFTPASITDSSVFVFSAQDFMYWEDSLFRSFGLGLYGDSLSTMLASHRGYESGANAGLVGSGFAQAGIVGVLFYSLINLMLVKIVDAHGRSLPVWVGYSMAFLLAKQSILSSDTVTTLSTHGFLFLLILVISISNLKKRSVYFVPIAKAK